VSGIVGLDTERKRALMPHLKCSTCRTRLFADGEAPVRCDGCGALMEPVGDLAEIVGYQAMPAPERQVDEGSFEAAVAAALRRPDTLR